MTYELSKLIFVDLLNVIMNIKLNRTYFEIQNIFLTMMMMMIMIMNTLALFETLFLNMIGDFIIFQSFIAQSQFPGSIDRDGDHSPQVDNHTVP